MTQPRHMIAGLILGLFLSQAAPLHAEEPTAEIPPEIEAPFAEENPGDDLPEPSLGETSQKKKNNVDPDEDALFLPPPASDTTTYSDSSLNGNEELNSVMQSGNPRKASPSAPNYAGHSMYGAEESDPWSGLPNSRPAFSIMAGAVSRTYPNPLIEDSVFGVGGGGALRVWQAAPQIAFFANAMVSFVSIGDVGTAKGLDDRVYRFGATGEFSVSRRFHLIAGIHYFRNVISALKDPVNSEESAFLKDEKFKPGIGAQYDIYSIPHASLGVRIYFEKDYSELALNFSFEAAPRKRMSFNYNWGEY